jgi:hypothetical protein
MQILVSRIALHSQALWGDEVMNKYWGPSTLYCPLHLPKIQDDQMFQNLKTKIFLPVSLLPNACAVF